MATATRPPISEDYERQDYLCFGAHRDPLIDWPVAVVVGAGPSARRVSDEARVEAPTQGQIEIDAGVQPLSPRGQMLALGDKGISLCFEHHQIAHQPGVVALIREALGFDRLCGGNGQGLLLLSEKPLGRQRGFHLSKSPQDHLGIALGELSMVGFGELDTTAEPPTLIERLEKIRRQAPDREIEIQQITDIAAQAAGGAGESKLWIERGPGLLDAETGGREPTLGGDQIGSPGHQLRG